MKIFVFEYITGGGLHAADALDDPPESLLREGWAMVHALAADFAHLPETKVTILQDNRTWNHLPDLRSVKVASEQDHWTAFNEEVASADAVVVIAPEFDNILVDYCRRVECLGGDLIGPTANWVEIAADKQVTCERLAVAGVPTVDGMTLASGSYLPPEFPYPAVLKRRDGAGSCDTVVLRSVAVAEQHPPVTHDMRLEPLVAGRPASVALLCGPEQTVCLAPCEQWLSNDDTLSYCGGQSLPDGRLATRAQSLARRTILALGPTSGYVGVDLLLDEAGEDDLVVEVNPRLTTSYVGLRAAYDANLAGLLLDLAAGRPIDEPSSARQVQFKPDGTITS